jgi:DHA2 family multidrug resistance protein
MQGVGLGFIFVPLSTTTFATLAPELRTQATALFSLMRNVGSSIGISIVIFLLTRNTQVVHSTLVEHVTPYDPWFRIPGLAGPWDIATASGRAMIDAEITRQASAIAYINDYKLMMIIAILTLPLLLVIRPVRAGAKAEAAVVD